MKPALALEPVHWQGEVVGDIRKFDSRQTYMSVANRAATDFEETCCE
jgi:hypothetical protein